MIARLVFFLLANFLALAIGGYFTGPGVASDWYAGLPKAPWTPPGWIFGFAWTSIMVCLGLYLAFLWEICTDKAVLLWLYSLQWLLNVMWNPAFFYFHQVGLSLMVICGLSLVVAGFLWNYRRTMNWKSALLLPYLVWLLIACSLNAYIWHHT